jgi:(p)ppGpp synthase/HD superfamily hydrolase
METMETMEMFDGMYARALQYAAIMHDREYKKGTTVPYLVHPVMVASIVTRAGGDAEVVVAALLHDVPENAAQDRAGQAEITENIGTIFGERVQEIVAAVTEEKWWADGKKRPWGVRKDDLLEQVRAGGHDAALVFAADGLHSAIMLRDDLLQADDPAAFWTRFNAPKAAKLAYELKRLDVCSSSLGERHPLVQELRRTLVRLQQVAG